MKRVISGIVDPATEDNETAMNAMSSPPARAAKEPVTDIPPLVPAGTASRLMMLRVRGSRLPISEASVSAAATDIEAAAAR